jgi:hypothetical protein
MEFHFLHLQRPYRFEAPLEGEFVLLLEVTDAVTAEEQRALSEAISASGCRYALCRGVGCSSWDDSLDEASVAAELGGEVRPFLMTTWHEHEPLEDVLHFMLECTAFDDFVPTVFVVAELGGDGRKLAEARLALEHVGRGSEP